MPKLKLLDYIIPALSAGMAIFCAVAVYGGGIGTSLVYIQSEAGEEVYPLDEGRTVGVEGPIGTTFVEIDEGGSAAVVESPCPNDLCVHTGELIHRGDWAACMPNKVFVRIDGGPEDEEDVDSAAY